MDSKETQTSQPTAKAIVDMSSGVQIRCGRCGWLLEKHNGYRTYRCNRCGAEIDWKEFEEWITRQQGRIRKVMKNGFNQRYGHS